MKTTVNLDAMLVREDFLADPGYDTSNRFKQLDVHALKNEGTMLHMLRKPDFQRETKDWNAEQVSDFLLSILEGHFIPSIILWQNTAGVIFVIDGAHRLSALAAWVNDDYGDGIISSMFYKQKIGDVERKIAQRARTQIEKKVGKYSMYTDAIKNPQRYAENIRKLAMGLESFAFDVQWIKGDVSVAETSFFNINQKPVLINPTELKILKVRNKPLGIATRAIAYSGKGYKYWGKFDSSIQVTIEKVAEEINNLLFLPKTKKPIMTLDVAIAGKKQMDLNLIYDLLVYANEEISEQEDEDGNETVNLLKNTKRVLELINSKTPGSLGLHPIVYFYSRKGNFKPANFYAVILFVKELKEKKQFDKFISVRASFEDFIYKNDYIINQMNRNLRSTKNSAVPLKQLFIFIMDSLTKGLSEKDVLLEIKKMYPKIDLIDNSNEMVGSNFNSNRKSETYISEAMKSAVRCSICGGILHVNSTSIDHITRKREGGAGSVENGQITHPYCNTGYKN